jgi:hypothetical protein
MTLVSSKCHSDKIGCNTHNSRKCLREIYLRYLDTFFDYPISLLVAGEERITRDCAPFSRLCGLILVYVL